MRLLLVSAARSGIDQTPVQNALRLLRRDWQVSRAASGYEAITCAIRDKPDVVLMQVEMETRLAGLYACKEICLNLADTRVILRGESEDADTVVQAFRLGAVDFLSTSCDALEIVHACTAAADGQAGIHYAAAKAVRQRLRALLALEENLDYEINVLIRLTPTEIDLLKLMYEGMHYKDVARVRFIEVSTMKAHITHILRKFHLENMAQVMQVLHASHLFSLIHPTE